MQVSLAHRRVIYDDLPDPGRIMTLLPDAKRLASGQTVVPLRIRDMQIMAHLKIPAVSPIEYDYDWPSRFPQPRPNQLVTAAFKTLNPRNVDTSDMRCVDCETEYLSPTGWRRMDQYDGGQVAQYWPETGIADFVDPIGYHVSACNEMYRFRTTRGVDQKLSSGHRVLYQDINTKKLHVITAHDVALAEARLKKGWPGAFLTSFKGVGGSGLDLTDAQLRMQVAIIADGSFVAACPKSLTCRITVKKERKKSRLRSLLTNAEISFKETPCNTREGYATFTFKAPRRDKVFDSYYWAASADQLNVVADEVRYWDGHVTRRGVVIFNSVEKQSADFIQYAFAATDRAAHLYEHGQRPPYRMQWAVGAHPYARARALAGWRADKKKTEPVTVEPTTDGKMYCFQVPSTFLVFRRNGCIFMSGNTGKTLSSLWAADYLMGQGLIRKCLIIAPLSTLERVWASEIEQSLYRRRTFSVLYGDRERRLKRLNENADFMILNHDGLTIGSRRPSPYKPVILGPLVQAIIERDDIDLCIIDELSMYKHHVSLRFKVIERMFEAKPAMWRWGLTGTPAATAPTDAWAQGRLIYGKESRHESFETFRDRTMFKVGEFKWRPKLGSDQIVAQWLQPSIRFTRKELGFPALDYEVRPVEMSAAQIKAYKAMKKDLEIVTERGETISAVNEAVLRTKLIQIACGAVYGEDHKAHYLDAKPRIDMVRDIIEEAGGKFLIFAPFTSVIEMIFDALKKEISCAIVNGNTTVPQRNKIMKAFQDAPEPRVAICDPRCMAHGTSWTAADTIIWFAPTDNLEIYEQANARIDGPEACGVVIQLSSSPVEKELYRRQQEKQQLQGSILHILRNG